MLQVNEFKWSFSQNRIRKYKKIGNKIVWESYPKSAYKNLNKEQIDELLSQLNFSIKKTEIIAEPIYLVNFRKKLETEITKKKHIDDIIRMLNLHILKFFGTNKINQWKQNEEKFGQYLLKSNLSSSRVKAIIQTANRYIKFNHEKNPNSISMFTLKPLSKIVVNTLKKKNTKNRLITEIEFKQILERIKPDIKPAVILGFRFGLRCSEILGLTTEDVYMDYLLIERQYDGCNKITTTKSKTSRMIPYWGNINPEETYNLISKLKKMYPGTLSKRFIKDSRGHQMHDLRRSWITLSLRNQHYRDVQLAAGHTNIETTQKYIQDDRMLNSRRFVPIQQVQDIPR